jgi:hypothetical protein
LDKSGHKDRGHAGGGRSLDAEIGVFEDQAFFGWHAEPLGREQKCIGGGLAVRVIFRADNRLAAAFARFGRLHLKSVVEAVEVIEESDGAKQFDDFAFRIEARSSANWSSLTA